MNQQDARRNAGNPRDASLDAASRRHFLKQLAGLGAGGLLLLHGLSGCDDSVSGPDTSDPPPATEKPDVPDGLSPALNSIMTGYINRVYEHGGRIIDLEKLTADLIFLEQENLLSALHSAFLPHAGLQQSGNNGPVSRWFNILQQGDGIQTNEQLSPVLEDDALHFNRKVMRFEGDTAGLLRLQSGHAFTAIFLADIQAYSGYALSVAQRLEILMNASNNATPRFNLNGSVASNISRAGTSQGGLYANTLVYDGTRPNEADFYFNNVFERRFDEFSARDTTNPDAPLFMGMRSEEESSGPDMRVYGLWLFDRALEAEEIAAFSLFQKRQFPGMGWNLDEYPEIQEEELLTYLDALHRAGGYLRLP